MEEAVLWKIHGFSSAWLDDVFLASDVAGGWTLSSTVVVALAVWHLSRREWRAAGLWIGMGALVLAEMEGLKALVERARPELWTRLVTPSGSSFPSGHALAASSLYPLWAWGTCRGPAVRVAGPLSLLGALAVGLGRLYLGVHWPTDVLAGWALGAAQSALALRRFPVPAAAKAPLPS